MTARTSLKQPRIVRKQECAARGTVFADQRHREHLLVCKRVGEGSQQIAAELQALGPRRGTHLTTRSKADHRRTIYAATR